MGKPALHQRALRAMAAKGSRRTKRRAKDWILTQLWGLCSVKDTAAVELASMTAWMFVQSIAHAYDLERAA